MPSEDLCTDKVLSKSRILQELTKAVKLVYAQSLHGSVVLDGDSWLVYWLDRALRHGLRVERHGYWGTARELSHQDTKVVIHALQNVLTSIGKGRAWLYHTLSEGSFESYLACLLRDHKTLQKQYFPHALVRDIDKTNQLINLLAGLENVSFVLQLDVTYLDICNYMPRRPMSGSPSGTILSLHLRSSSLSSSLASPGDNGVTLDSDMDLANEMDSNSYKEDLSMGDLSKYRNNKYNAKTLNDKSMERSSSSDSSESGKSPTNIRNSDIMNQNLTRNCDNDCELDNSELRRPSVDSFKDYCYYGKSLDETRLDRNNCSSTYCGDGSYCFKKSVVDPRNSYVINNDTNLLELSMTISDCDNTYDAPYSILNTIHVSDTGILSSSSGESHVQRRQRKKKRGENKKRVSFHEDIFKMMKLEDDESFADFSLSFRQPRRDRYSWCANGDSSYQQRKVEGRHVRSDCYSMMSVKSEIDSNKCQCDQDYYQSSLSCSCLSLAERGVPEGQEDPASKFRPKIEIKLEENEAQEAYIVEKQFGNVVEDPPVKLDMPQPSNPRKYANQNDWSDVESVTTDTLDDTKNTRHLSSPLKKRSVTSVLSSEGSKLLAPPLRQIASKSSLLSRFLRSITERKFENKKNSKPPVKQNPLYIKGAKVDGKRFDDFNEMLDKEIRENSKLMKSCSSGEEVSSELEDLFRRTLYRDKSELLYKVYKISSSYMSNGESKPMLALLTNNTLYLTGFKTNHTYSNQFVIPYTELDIIMLGPNAQTILISNADYEMQYLLQTGCAQATAEFIGHLEIAMRRSSSKPKLPSVKQLTYDDMHALKRSILAETAVHPDEKIEYYSLIRIEDEYMSPPGTPCGPTKEGDLMFRPHIYQSLHPNAPTNPWEAGYFVLKGGVIYMFADSNQRLPKRAIPLKGGLCQGCRRIPNSHRPHTFEILLKPNKAYQFAAPDEYVASEWLQSFVQSASGLFDSTEKHDPSACSLVVTTKHLIAIKEVYPGTQRSQTLCCANINDLTAFRIPSGRQPWCILEFACREVHENSGDWVVYFANQNELNLFQQILSKLWDYEKKEEEFPIVALLPDEKIFQRCSEANKNLENAWQHFLPVE